MAAYTPACRRCHTRKIKCDTNKPSCRPCTEANAVCQPHERQRRFPSQRSGDDTRRRLTWLEDGLSTQFGVNLRSIKTGANLGEHLTESSLTPGSHGSMSVPAPRDDSRLKSEFNEDNPEEFSMEVAPDSSLLTLNATGELRYLGPSSGSFFVKYASNFARKLLSQDSKRISSMGSQSANNSNSGERMHIPATETTAGKIHHLTPRISSYLLDCYLKWVQPMFPVLDQSYIRAVLEPLGSDKNQQEDLTTPGHESQRMTMTVYLLALALGAVHVTPQSHDRGEQACYLEYQDAFSSRKLSPDLFFIEALNHLDSMCKVIQPSIPFIQIVLLICIYGGYRPSGNRQWQLSGIAMRTAVEIGLHRHRKNWKFDQAELDLRQRVFWTAYAVELSAAFNLGRPPSIQDEHIDAQFPEESIENTMALHHIRHRQIQSKILNQVYCAPGRLNTLSDAEKNAILHKLQSELEAWRDALGDVCARSKPSYPLQYWERFYWCTSAALLRPTPLFPQPPIESTVRCIKFAGKFVEIHHDLLKSTNVPQSWMLLQGTLLSGITILVTARMNAASLLPRDDFSLFEVMEWSRKCSLILTIMSERWSEKSISNLEAKFSLLSTDTLKNLLALKDSLGRSNIGQGHYQNAGKTPRNEGSGSQMAYSLAIPQVIEQPRTSQNDDWPYQDSFQSFSPVGNYRGGNDNDMGSVNISTFGDFPLDYFGCGLSDPNSLEGFFGGDDLYSFWEVLPGANDLPLHFGQ